MKPDFISFSTDFNSPGTSFSLGGVGIFFHVGKGNDMGLKIYKIGNEIKEFDYLFQL